MVIVGTPMSSEVRKVDVAAPPLQAGDPELDPASNAEDEILPAEFVMTVYDVRVDQFQARPRRARRSRWGSSAGC